jgi:hypothetical protein
VKWVLTDWRPRKVHREERDQQGKSEMFQALERLVQPFWGLVQEQEVDEVDWRGVSVRLVKQV